ncbi:lipid-A-disaccharide synthase [Magnetovibrio sp.]|uniref:lipid-A-disaccharide synthase n=1 Tax=Magnetovibrio sp. TaxID=2024836 RepID=UPI002F94C1F4
MTNTERVPLVFLIAGENSGDALGASLMKALKLKTDGHIRFAGVGGPEMTAQGLTSLFPMQDLAVMGVFEVLPRLALLLRRMTQTTDEIERLAPDAVVSIDAPDFCFRVIKKLKSRRVDSPVIHYVAPTVWAWRPSRAAKVAKFLDHLMCLLPFEPPYFHREGLDATFVGHPVVTQTFTPAMGGEFRDRHNIAVDTPVLCVLPGSRSGEVSRLLAVFGETVERLQAQFPALTVIIPTVDHVAETVRATVAAWNTPTVVVGANEKRAAFCASDAALAASGTVSLELAMAGLPHVIGYRVNALTAFVGKMLIKTPYVNLINICLGREVVPEFIQENCTPDNLAREVARLLDDEGAREVQRAQAADALTQLGRGGPPPGERAADVVLGVMNKMHKREG